MARSRTSDGIHPRARGVFLLPRRVGRRRKSGHDTQTRHRGSELDADNRVDQNGCVVSDAQLEDVHNGAKRDAQFVVHRERSPSMSDELGEIANDSERKIPSVSSSPTAVISPISSIQTPAGRDATSVSNRTAVLKETQEKAKNVRLAHTTNPSFGSNTPQRNPPQAATELFFPSATESGVHVTEMCEPLKLLQPKAESTIKIIKHVIPTQNLESPTKRHSETLPKEESDSNIMRRVLIVNVSDKKHCGKVGIIVRKLNSLTYQVRLLDCGTMIGKRLPSLQFLDENDETGNMQLEASNSQNVASFSNGGYNGQSEPLAVNHSTKIEEKALGRSKAQQSTLTCGDFEKAKFTDPSSNREAVGRTPKIAHDSLLNREVEIIRGEKKFLGKQGLTIRATRRGIYAIQLHCGYVINKRINSLRFLEKSSVLEEACPDAKVSKRDLLRNSLNSSSPMSEYDTEEPIKVTSGDALRVADAGRGGVMLGLRHVTKMRTSHRLHAKDACLLTHIFGHRILIQDIPFNKNELQEPLERYMEHDGSRFELVSIKIQHDGEIGNTKYCHPKCVSMCFVQVTGRDIEPISLERTLLGLANFSLLDPRKVKSRLELLQSPAYMLQSGAEKRPLIFTLPNSYFAEIPDQGANQGCGFISEVLLEKLLGSKGLAKRTVAVQVRILIPRLGFFKGVLFRKHGLSQQHIELPSSMRKVGPSNDTAAPREGLVLITKNGVHPSTVNLYLNRRLDLSAKPPPVKSFFTAIKPLSEMIVSLWRGMGVPEDIVMSYVENRCTPVHLSHAWVVGVADPTGCIPPGHVVVTGLANSVTPRGSIFISRSPCLEPDDGRLVPILQSRPVCMGEVDWNWLCRLSFGAVIFGGPEEGMKPLPECIAQGDLDGDLYFVCWDRLILEHMTEESEIDVPADSDEVSERGMDSTSEENKDDSNIWLEKAQSFMVDTVATEASRALIGELYQLSQKVIHKSPLRNKDPDAILFARAYKRALDLDKHGGQIKLPIRLRGVVRAALQEFISWY